MPPQAHTPLELRDTGARSSASSGSSAGTSATTDTYATTPPAPPHDSPPHEAERADLSADPHHTLSNDGAHDAVNHAAPGPDANNAPGPGLDLDSPRRVSTGGGSRRSSFAELSLSFFGFDQGRWKKILIFHVVLTLLFNGYNFAISTYSTFFAQCQNSSTNDVLLKMQRVLSNDGDLDCAVLNRTLTQLAELKEWEEFNRWVLTCAAYAVWTTLL